jgi:transposase-like protein
VNAIIESYLLGVSTRNVENVISHLGVNQISASYVSKVARELDVKITEFMESPYTPTFPISTSMHRTSK